MPSRLQPTSFRRLLGLGFESRSIRLGIDRENWDKHFGQETRLIVKIIFSGSAILAAALLISFLTFARPMAAETRLSQFQHKQAELPAAEDRESPLPEALAANPMLEPGVTPPQPYVATAYSLRGRTASGRTVRKGIVAADPRVLPLGSRIRLEAGSYSGEYLVADTGGAVRGRKIDIWIPSTREALRFGRRKVKLTVLSWGPKRQKRTRVQK